MIISRGDFLQLGLGARSAHILQHDVSSVIPGTISPHFDMLELQRVCNVVARHKQCFGITSLSSGDPLRGMQNSLDTYAYAFGEGPGALKISAVLYHGASLLYVLDDLAWKNYVIPSMSHMPDVVRRDIDDMGPVSGNPFLGDAAFSVTALGKRGVSFMVCNNSLVGLAGIVSAALTANVHETYEMLRRSIIGGALIVPAGVMALNALQEARYTYIAY